jgi:hypothetical protein
MVDHERIVKLAEKGLTQRAIAKRLGCHHSTVNHCLRGRGLLRRDLRRRAVSDLLADPENRLLLAGVAEDLADALCAGYAPTAAVDLVLPGEGL